MQPRCGRGRASPGARPRRSRRAVDRQHRPAAASESERGTTPPRSSTTDDSRDRTRRAATTTPGPSIGGRFVVHASDWAAMLGMPDHITAGLFDLDGVLTQTAKIHAAAWKQMFDAFLRE